MSSEDLKAGIRQGRYHSAKTTRLSTFSGARALRRSQTMMIGEVSSSLAVTSLVAYPKG
jgi:hypothetical protein